MYYSDFTKCVFTVFMVVMHILLMNMLIAMMGNTYHQVIKRSKKEYKRQVKEFSFFSFSVIFFYFIKINQLKKIIKYLSGQT